MKSRETRLIASASMRYRGRMLHAGDEFDAPEKDAESLVATRFAERMASKHEPHDDTVAAQVDDAEKAEGYLRRNVQAEAAPNEIDRPKREYKRRDRTAEE